MLEQILVVPPCMLGLRPLSITTNGFSPTYQVGWNEYSRSTTAYCYRTYYFCKFLFLFLSNTQANGRNLEGNCLPPADELRAKEQKHSILNTNFL
mmetsp:Transcript_26576/g.40214  ORF Transcript_26576/g.40214 Transcript_26576/m.40214 type:complete len:95 (+) Transcript_26576:906-1190(+)